MPNIKQRLSDTFHGDQSTLSTLLLTCCSPASTLFASITKLRRYAYKRQWLQSEKLPVPVVSIGNITVGGTGKTPIIQAIAHYLQQQGKTPAILSRGYRGTYKNIQTVSDGKTILATATEVGDEPIQLAKQLPQTPIIVCRDRIVGGKYIIKHFHPDIILLDDGMQHLRLQRDLDITLIDATNPFGNKKTLPCGPLREPQSTLSHADAIIITKTNQTSSIEKLINTLTKLKVIDKVTQASFTTSTITNTTTHKTSKTNDFKSCKAFAFCGLGNTASFFTSCNKTSLFITGTCAFPDHHPYTSKDIQHIVSQAHASNAEFLITTEKDAARLTSTSFPLPLYTLNMIMHCDQQIYDRIIALI